MSWKAKASPCSRSGAHDAAVRHRGQHRTIDDEVFGFGFRHEELADIFDDDRWAVRTRSAGRATASGTFAIVRHGPIPERRLRADGTLDVDGRSDREFPLQARLETGTLPDGRHVVELLVDDEPRLRTIVKVSGNTARLLELESPASRNHAKRIDS